MVFSVCYLRKGDREEDVWRIFKLLFCCHCWHKNFGHVHEWFSACCPWITNICFWKKSCPSWGKLWSKGTYWQTWDSPLAWKKGWREAGTSAQHDAPRRALSEGIFSRCIAGWFCPASKLIPPRGQFNCASIQLSLLPSADLTAPESVLHFWGWYVLGPFLCVPRAGQCHTSSWNRFRKNLHPPAVNSCVCFMTL